MSSTSAVTTIATIGLDLGKNTFHLVGLAIGVERTSASERSWRDVSPRRWAVS
jgi:hypothetical protein